MALRRAAHAAAVRFITLPLSAGVALVTSKTLIAVYGAQGYAGYMLLVSLPSLLPSRDMGFGARIVEVLAGRGSLNSAAREVGGAMGSLLIVSAVGIMASWVPGVLGWWPSLLGDTVRPLPDWSVSACLTAFFLALPFNVSSGIYLGLAKASALVWNSLALTVAAGIVVGIGAVVSLPLQYVIAGVFASWLAVQILAYLIAIQVSPLSFWDCRPRISRGNVRSMGWAGPMLVITGSGALVYQGGRVILSHQGLTTGVAEFSAAMQLYGPLLGIAVAAGQALWPHYTGLRDAGGPTTRELLRTTAAFGGLGGLLALVLAIVGPSLLSQILGLRIDRMFAWLLGLQLFLIVLGYPVGMLMTDRGGLRFQSLAFLAMLGLYGPTALVLVSSFGAAGVVAASALMYGCAVLLPSFVRARKYLSR